MKKQISIAAVALLITTALAADSNIKNEVVSGAQKLAAQDNYSWKESRVVGDNDRVTEAKTERDGFTSFRWDFGEDSAEGLLKGTNGVFKTEGTWQTMAEGLKAMKDSDYNGPPVWPARMLEKFVAPPAEAENLLSDVKNLKLLDGAYAGEMSEEGARKVLFPVTLNSDITVKTAKGSVKFWVKEGILSKYEYKVEGSITYNGEDRDIDERTTTVEIKDVGKTKVSVPEAAKKKLS